MPVNRHGALLFRLWTQSAKLILLALAPAHVWRALRQPAFRRAYPGYAARLRWLLIAEGLGLAAIGVSAPTLAAIAALILGGSALLLRWRARSDHGTRRGLPPGSLDLLAPAPLLDPLYYSAAARTHGTFFKCSHMARSQICVDSLATGREVLREHAASLRPLALPFHRFVPGGFLRRMEGPTHESYRKLFSSVLSPRLVGHWRGFLEATMTGGLERMAQASATAGPDGVRPRPHVEELILESWLLVFLGRAGTPEETGRLRELFLVVDIRNEQRASASAIGAALGSIEGIIRRRAQGWDYLASSEDARPTCVLRELLDQQPGALDDPTVLRNLIYLLGTSAGDVSGLLMWVLKQLSDHRLWLERLQADRAGTREPRKLGEQSLASRIVSETLRLRQSEFVNREVTDQIRYQGFRIPRGWLLRICVQESHRNPDVFEHPDVFDPDRFLQKRPTRDEYSPFGLDQHACIGESLARASAEVFANELAGYEWEVTADGPIEMNSWRHWAPNSRFRIRLAARPRESRWP